MKTKGLIYILLGLLLIIVTSCVGTSKERVQKDTAIVEKGNIEVGVTVDGNIEIPNGYERKDICLSFGTVGTVKDIYVREGTLVHAGTLLAKLDDSNQKLKVIAAQYDVELAMTQLAEKIYPALYGYPHYYPNFSALLWVEQAYKELKTAKINLVNKDYYEASSNLLVAKHDLKNSMEILKKTITDLDTYPDIAKTYLNYDYIKEWYTEYYPAIPNAIKTLEKEILNLEHIYNSISSADYVVALSSLGSVTDNFPLVINEVDKACGKIIRTGIYYPDASTTLSILNQSYETLKELQVKYNKNELNTKEFGEKLRMVLHDIEICRKILDENELLVKTGTNMNVLRQNNLNLLKAETTLKLAKKDLMNTELIAPIDGFINKIDIKVGEFYGNQSGLSSSISMQSQSNLSITGMSSAYYAQPAICIVSVSNIEMRGLIDEIDIFKVKLGQKANITIDALPGKVFEGEVTYVSPVSIDTAGVINFPVIISFNPLDMEPKKGLTANANIIVDSRENVLRVPNSAVKGSRNEYYVEVILNKEKGITEKRPITIGIQNNVYTEIISGLSEGEEVVVEKIRPTKSIF